MESSGAIDGSVARAVWRPVRWAVRGLLSALLCAWASAGYFMEGEDQLDRPVPYLVVLGGGIAGERDMVACALFRRGHGKSGVVLTGGDAEKFVPDRTSILKACGVPGRLVKHWSATANTYQEMAAVKQFVAAVPGVHVVVVSDALHMPRLRYLRGRFGLEGRVLLRQSRLGGRWDANYLMRVVEFWFREPLAYVYYRVRY